MNIKTVTLMALILLQSCNKASDNKEESNNPDQKRISQLSNGSISLPVNMANCYCDTLNPSSNTAEWNIKILKKGFFNVWISSATKDTTKLQYNSSVLFNIDDERVAASPACDKIIYNSDEVTLPFYKVDSFLGTLNIQDTGQYYCQIISDMLVPETHVKNSSAFYSRTRLLSINLKPVGK